VIPFPFCRVGYYVLRLPVDSVIGWFVHARTFTTFAHLGWRSGYAVGFYAFDVVRCPVTGGSAHALPVTLLRLHTALQFVITFYAPPRTAVAGWLRVTQLLPFSLRWMDFFQFTFGCLTRDTSRTTRCCCLLVGCRCRLVQFFH